jgi:hypothetical protein
VLAGKFVVQGLIVIHLVKKFYLAMYLKNGSYTKRVRGCGLDASGSGWGPMEGLL